MVARLGATYRATMPGGGGIVLSGQLSQGLGGLGALEAGNLPLGTTYSRQGASLGFTKADLSLNTFMPIGRDLQLTLVAKGQTSFGAALFRSEQSTLEGSDAVSAYVGGVTAVDESVTARAEFAGRFDLAQVAQVRPYVFIAGGTGRINRPTLLEPGTLGAGSAGVGLRAAIAGTGLGFGAEYAHGFSDYAPLRTADRVNASISLRF
jgi:hemolysin activation/secretion protein